jgi:hypothetical protein
MALTPSTPTHEYTIQYTSIWSSNLLFLLPSSHASSPSSAPTKIPVFSARTSELHPSKPDITLHDMRGNAKNDTTAPVIAVAHFRCTKHVHMGLGDPTAGPEKMKWTVMKKESIWSHSAYRFELGSGKNSNIQQKQVQQQIRTQNPTTTTFIPSISSLPNHHPCPQHRPHSYTWKRTRSTTNGIHGFEKLSSEHYKLQDNSTDSTIAVLLSDSWKFRKAGKLLIRDGLVWELEIAVVLSAATLLEMMRRRNATANAVKGGLNSLGGPAAN